MRTYTLEELRPGMKVIFVDTHLNDPASYVDAPPESNDEFLAGRLAMVIDVDPKRVGKVVALAFKDPVFGGHTCDGLIPDGHGWWALPEHLYSEAAWEEHEEAHAKALHVKHRVSDLLKGFIDA